MILKLEMKTWCEKFRFFYNREKDEKLFEFTLAFVTRSVLSNAVHMLQMEMILPDLTTSINSALQSRNPAVVCDALALINQFLIVGKIDLALNILQKPISSVLTTALKNQR